MSKPTFVQADTEKCISLLNFVATHAEFNKLSVKRVLEFTKLLNWAQTELLPKMESHIFEVVDLKQPEAKSKKK